MPTHVRLTDEDNTAISIIQQRHNLKSPADAVHYALERMSSVQSIAPVEEEHPLGPVERFSYPAPIDCYEWRGQNGGLWVYEYNQHHIPTWRKVFQPIRLYEV